MSSPTMASWKRLLRLGRYFLGKPRAIILFSWQPEANCFDIYTDANWAGCHKVRKSTSGGVVMLGRCCVKTWSKTQATIAQSSAESELLATVRGAAEGIGLISLSADLGLRFKVRLHIDAAAALGIIERRGVGRVRHLDVGTLWLQEQQLRKVVELKKVAGLENPSDLLTKHFTQERIDHYCELIGYSFADGRASSTAGLHFLRENVSLLDGINAATRLCHDATRLDGYAHAPLQGASGLEGYAHTPLQGVSLSHSNNEPRRCYGCGKGFRSHNRLHAHIASGSCEDMLLNDARHLGHRGRAISAVTEKLSRGRTSHVQIEDRGRAISTHRRDVLDIATSRN
jgi:hypothetical protein